MKQTCLLCFVGVFLLTAGIPARGEETVTPAALQKEILKLMDVGVEEATIVSFVEEHPLSAPLSADDIVEWKKAGISDAVMQAAMGSKKSAETKEETKEKVTRTIPMSSDIVHLNITVNPIEFQTVQAIVDKPRRGMQKVTIVVKGVNIGTKDHFGIVRATLLDGKEQAISVRTKQKSLEEKERPKTIEVEFDDLSEQAVSSIDKFRLDFAVYRGRFFGVDWW